MLRNDQVGPPSANLSRHVTPQAARVFYLTVFVAEKLYVPDTEYPRGPLLLFLANRRQAQGCDGTVTRALVPVRHDDVGDFAAFLH